MHGSDSKLPSNSFTFLRLALALLVVLGHSFPLGGFGRDPLWIFSSGKVALHTLALLGFFAISGYLLSMSLGRSTDIRRFTLRRAFRILPGYWAALAATAFILTPLLFQYIAPGELGYLDALLYTDGKISDQHALNYFLHNLAVWQIQYGIFPIFINNPHPGWMNGSLWSLSLEILCYTALAAFSIGKTRHLRTLTLAFTSALLLAVIAQHIHDIPPFPEQFFGAALLNLTVHPRSTGCCLAFFTGASLYLLTHGRPVWNTRLFITALLTLSAATATGLFDILWPITLPYILIALGEKLPFQKLDRIGDFSYGIYIYAFPIQQTLALFGIHRYGFTTYTALAILLSTILGTFSWFLIERPAIALGQRLLTRITSREN